jgi:hypothetical protein
MPYTRVKSDGPTVQIAHLRAQVEALTKERVTPAVTEMAGRAERALNSAVGVVRGPAATVSGHVRDQPLIAVLLAAGIGYVLGRALR